MYLLKEPDFCEQLARFLKPDLFTTDFIKKSSFGPSTKLSGIIESKIQIWTPAERLDATFTVTNLYSKIYRAELSESGWVEYDADDVKRSAPSMTETVYTFNVIARDHLKLTEGRFTKSLWHYHFKYKANCLLVRSIKVEDLTLNSLQTAVKKAGLDLVVWNVVLK